MIKKVHLYINTIKYLHLSQIYYRLRNRLKREMYKRNLLQVKLPNELEVQENFSFIIPELDFAEEYLDRFDDKDILINKFSFINIAEQVELSNAWNDKELQHLWRYNLHYFEYLYKLAWAYSNKEDPKLYYNKYKDLIENWIENNPFAYGDGWHPYTISLRVTNWISTYQIFKDSIVVDNHFSRSIKRSIYLQYHYLKSNLEKDVLGNHYFENIKALIIGSIFFGEKEVRAEFVHKLLNQLDIQILDDGVHYELSPMYHKIILEDLIRITYWLKGEPVYKELVEYIQKMCDVIYSLEVNFGKTPAFNDSADGVSKNYQSILNVCKQYFGIKPKYQKCFDHSGFYIIEDQCTKLIFDTGEICPSNLPAHAHCDALSFELSIDSLPTIVNSGTYIYESGKWRNYFRSTKAHNTIVISNKEQSQYWASFRVAKRISKVRRRKFIYNNIIFYSGAYVAYHGIEHKRFIGFIDKNKILVLDIVNSEISDIKSYIHFVPEAKIDVCNNDIYVITNKSSILINPIGTSNIKIEQGWYSEQMNLKKRNNHLVIEKNKNAKFFGYILDMTLRNNEIITSEHQLKIVGNNELIINVKELGDML